MKFLLYNDKLLQHTCKEATSKECEGIYLITIKPFQDMSTSCVLLRNYLTFVEQENNIPNLQILKAAFQNQRPIQT